MTYNPDRSTIVTQDATVALVGAYAAPVPPLVGVANHDTAMAPRLVVA